MNEFWNKRFASEEYIYGKNPNEFFKESIDGLKPGRILFLGEGEGRNAVYAAKLGWKVDCVDFSFAARDKALKLAADNNVKLNYNICDVNELKVEENYYYAVVIIFLHLDQGIRQKVHKNVIKLLKPAGRVIFEAFDKEQINKNSGGPKNLEMLYSLEEVFEDFQDLDILKFSKTNIELNESNLHKGDAVVIKFIGQKPE